MPKNSLESTNIAETCTALRATDTPLTGLALRSSVTDSNFDEFIAAFEANHTLEKLFIYEQNLSAANLGRLMRVVNTKPQLIDVWLERKKPEGASGEADPNRLVPFLEAFQHNTSLLSLGLGGYDFNAPAASGALQNALEGNRSLLNLNCGSCELSTSEATEALFTALKENKTLAHLDLSNSKLHSHGINILAEALKNNAVRLARLDLMECAFTSLVNMEILVDALKTNTTLLALVLNGCPVDAHAGVQITRVLAEYNKTLRCLELGFVEDFDAVMTKFSEALKINKTLRKLVLTNCFLLRHDSPFMQAFSINQALTTLDISENARESAQEALIVALVEMFEAHRNLTSLTLGQMDDMSAIETVDLPIGVEDEAEEKAAESDVESDTMLEAAPDVAFEIESTSTVSDYEEEMDAEEDDGSESNNSEDGADSTSTASSYIDLERTVRIRKAIGKNRTFFLSHLSGLLAEVEALQNRGEWEPALEKLEQILAHDFLQSSEKVVEGTLAKEHYRNVQKTYITCTVKLLESGKISDSRRYASYHASALHVLWDYISNYGVEEVQSLLVQVRALAVPRIAADVSMSRGSVTTSGNSVFNEAKRKRLREEGVPSDCAAAGGGGAKPAEISDEESDEEEGKPSSSKQPRT